MPTLYFMFPGVQVQIPNSAYVVNYESNLCLVELLTLSTTDDEVLLGDTLFHEYSITFDKNDGKIGFHGET